MYRGKKEVNEQTPMKDIQLVQFNQCMFLGTNSKFTAIPKVHDAIVYR